MSQNKPRDIEVGEVASDGLRLWRARKAVEQGDKRLADQATSYEGLTTRATAILGWNVTLNGAFIALIAPKGARLPMIVVAIWATVTSTLSIAALWTREWKYPSVSPEWLITTELSNELMVLEEFAEDLQKSMKENAAILRSRARVLRLAWISFGLLPIIGTVSYLLI